MSWWSLTLFLATPMKIQQTKKHWIWTDNHWHFFWKLSFIPSFWQRKARIHFSRHSVFRIFVIENRGKKIQQTKIPCICADDHLTEIPKLNITTLYCPNKKTRPWLNLSLTRDSRSLFPVIIIPTYIITISVFSVVKTVGFSVIQFCLTRYLYT